MQFTATRDSNNPSGVHLAWVYIGPATVFRINTAHNQFVLEDANARSYTVTLSP
jgi:hypothetical protein